MLSSFLYEISHDSLWYWKVGILIWTPPFCHLKSRRHRRSMKKSYLKDLKWSLIRLNHLDVSVCKSHVAQAASQTLSNFRSWPSQGDLCPFSLVLTHPAHSTVVTFQPGEIFKKTKTLLMFASSVTLKVLSVLFSLIFYRISLYSLSIPIGIFSTPSIRCLDPHPAAAHSWVFHPRAAPPRARDTIVLR